MADNLRLQVIFNGIDKLSGPIKNMSKGSAMLSASMKSTLSDIAKLNRESGKVAGLTKMRDELAGSHREMDEVRRKIRDLRAEMAQTAKPSKELTRSLREMEKEERRLSSSTAKQSVNLQKLQGELTAAGVDVSRLGQHQSKLTQQIASANRQLGQQTKHLARRQQIENGAGRVASGAGGVGAGATATISAPLIYFGKQAYVAKMNAAELDSAFNTTFGNMAKHMDAWAKATAKTMGRGRSEIKGMAMSYQLLFDKALDPAKAAELSKTFTVLTQDLASFRNLSNEVSAQKIMSGLSGEAEPLRAVGVFLSEAKVEAVAAAMGLEKVNGKLTEEQKILARSVVIRKELAKASGDVARTRESEVNQLKEASGLYQDLQEDIGSKLLPKMRPLLKSVISLLEAFNNLSPGTQEFLVVASGLAVIFGPLMLGISGLASVIGVLAGPIAALAGPIRGFITMLRGLHFAGIAANALKLLAGGAMMAGRAILFVGRAMLMNPIGLLVTAIAVGAYLIYTYWDQIKAAFLRGFEAIKALGAKAWQLGSDIVTGLVNGIVNFGFKVGQALYNLATSAWKRVTDFFETRSPSRKFMALGGHLSEGLAIGIKDSAKTAIYAAGKLATGVTAASALSLSPVGAAAPARGAQGQSLAAAGAAPIYLTVNVYGAQGQDAGTLADEVIRKIEQKTGIRARSGYDDGL